MTPVTAAAALVSGGKPPEVGPSPGVSSLPGLRVGREAGAKRGRVHHLGEPAGALSGADASP